MLANKITKIYILIGFYNYRFILNLELINTTNLAYN